MAAPHLDIFSQQFIKTGEELCGDTLRIERLPDRTLLVLSDGLGSGVKANILSTLTSSILLTMLAADAPLDETVQTVIGTLPVCQVRKLAYATFTVVRIDHASGRFDVTNFDNPRVVWLKNAKLQIPKRQPRSILGREVFTFQGTLETNDFLAIFSDGVLHAGLGTTMNLGWGWENVARYIEEAASIQTPMCVGRNGEPDTSSHRPVHARDIVQRVMRRVWELYGGRMGDDCSLIGLLAREHRTLTILTGPPLDRSDDERAVARFLAMPGRHAVCGGTTGNIVARYLNETPEVVISSMRSDIPPIARLRNVELVTEGMLTMNRATELLGATLENPRHPLPDDDNGATLLARELLQADTVNLLVGRRINDVYQNPNLPPNLSLRRNLINELATLLRSAGKQVNIENL